MSDEELMRAIQIDDQLAFSELYRRYKSPLYSYLYRLVSPQLAEELLQDVFLKVLQKRATFRFESKVKTWLWTVMKNTLRDHWRSVDHKMINSFESLVNEDGSEIYQAPLSSNEELILAKITQKQLEICVDELPHDQKEVVLLHLQSELSHQEIAELTQYSVAAIKSVLFRVKEKLIECFKRGGHL